MWFFACSINSSASRTFVNNSSSPHFSAQCWTRDFHVGRSSEWTNGGFVTSESNRLDEFNKHGDTLVNRHVSLGLRIAAKTVVLTSEVQPPSSLHTNNGTVLRVLKQEEAHKWLGCMISAAGSRNTHLDLQHHLQAASRAFHANKWILCNKGVSILHRLRYFDEVVSPVACFGASHRAIHKDDLAKLDVEYRRLMRMVVGPPADTNWGIAMARYLAWMEQQSTDTVGPRCTATLVCHMHRNSLEICILCCNFTSRTMDPQDSRMEHEKATETRATGLHLGNSAANVFDLERLWQLHYGGCCTWTLDANEAGFCSFHLA